MKDSFVTCIDGNLWLRLYLNRNALLLYESLRRICIHLSISDLSLFRTNTPSTCLPPHRDRRRDRYKSDGSYGVSSVKNATQASIYKGPRQRDGNVYHHDEHVSLLNGNAAAESAVANTRSTQNGNNVRTSQVKFLLPDNSQNSCDTPVGLNNNKEVFGPNSDSKVIASTDV